MAVDTLGRLQRALVRGGAQQAAALASDTEAGERLAAVARNVAALRLEDLTLRYVAETGEVDDDGWTAVVELTWRYAGFDSASARTEIEVGFGAGGRSVERVAGGQGSTPVWLSGPVEVRRTARSLVVAAAPARRVDRVAAQARQALVEAEKVLGPAPRGLVVEVPGSVEGLHAALDAEDGTYDAVAAVTTSPDGALVRGSPVHVFLNPDVYGRLRPVAAQVVMTHEAVHALTDAPLSQGVALWLVEGFADYVALRDVDLPVATTAGQVIAQVRRRGVPGALPDRVEFDLAGPHLGAAYEAAWLACVTLAEHAGEDALVAFYRAVLAGADLEAQLGRWAGWSLADLTAAWQDRLRTLAGGG